jgi:hypothetical protein
MVEFTCEVRGFDILVADGPADDLPVCQLCRTLFEALHEEPGPMPVVRPRCVRLRRRLH